VKKSISNKKRSEKDAAITLKMQNVMFFNPGFKCGSQILAPQLPSLLMAINYVIGLTIFVNSQLRLICFSATIFILPITAHGVVFIFHGGI
jgi:hypothetical protein